MGRTFETKNDPNSLSHLLQAQPTPVIQFSYIETEFVLFLAVLEVSVLPMGWDSSHER